MAYIGEESNIMRPEKGDLTVTLPVTFDYSGGRKEQSKYKILWSVAVAVMLIIVAFGFLTRSSLSLIVRLILFVATLALDMFIIRYGFYRESTIRKYYKDLESTNYEKDFQDYWGIYSIDDEYPYYVRYRNGRTGLFVRLNKDVILGKYSESEYDHYEAIGDAYNIAGASNISMCSIDCMDNVGSDERLQESFSDLEKVSNPDVKDILMDMFGYLQSQMNERVTTYDVYLFTFNCSEIAAWNNINRILSCFMDANYVGYHILDANDIRDLFKSLYHLHEFSVNSAMANTFSYDTSYVGVIPIKIIHADGTEEIINKTLEEQREEAKLAEEEKQAREAEMKRRKHRKRKKSKDAGDGEEFDLFD